MKNKHRFWFTLLLVITLCSYVSAQTSLGSSKNFLGKLKKDLASSTTAARGSGSDLSLKLSDSKEINAKINYKKSDASSEFLIGEIKNVSQSSFYLKVMDKSVEGHIILKATNEAYKYYSDANGNAFVNKVDINSLICVNYTNVPQKQQKATTAVSAQISQAMLNLQSLPGAAGCVLLDFDGYNMPAGNLWNNGNAINAAPSGMTDADIQQHWEVVSEDYRPFNVNITTNEGVFNTYPKNRRMRVVITPTNTAAPGAGGVAYIGSFNWDNDVPCWVFITSGKSGGDATAHEVGHTFDLGHDGRELPTGHEEYFVGLDNTSWAPIMGAGYYRPVVQWSKGEYQYANQFQDDVATIAGAKFGVGYRGDDYSDNTNGAANLDYNGNGDINQKYGIISSQADYDFFSFTTSGGNVVINANTVGRDGNLHVLLRLYDASSNLIGTYWNSDPYALNATMNVNLGAGKYYVGVDGNGAGNASSGGYSSYGSIGSYWVTGHIPPSANVNSSTGLVTAYDDCNYTGFSGGLDIGDYNMAALAAKGIRNDNISSIKIAQGYKAILWQDDNFTGGSVTLTSDLSCFDGTWNDKVTSLQIRANGATNLAGTYSLQNRNSGLNLDVVGGPGGSSADGINVQQWNVTNTTNQQFKFEHLGDGVYKITAVHSGKCLDVNGISKDNGANVHQWTYYGTPNQQFIAVATDSGYYKLIAKHSGKLVEVAGFSTAAEGNVQQWENVNQSSGQWKLNTITTSAFTKLIQAEDYNVMAGIQTEATTDTGGGLNVGYTDNGDYTVYNAITFPTTGSYLVEYRVASLNGGAKISLDLNAGSIQLGAVNVGATGGWQTWTTVSHTVTITAGTYNLGVFFAIGGVNLNWVKITKVGAARGVEETTANTETAVASKVVLSPNPVGQELNVESNLDLLGSTINIYDLLGAKEAINTSVKNGVIDVSSLATGLYIFNVTTASGETITRKFIKN